jgi:hypothetical protein
MIRLFPDTALIFILWKQTLFSFFFSVLGLELRAYTWSHSTSPFCVRCFRDRVSQTICLGWFQTLILLISASQVPRCEPPVPSLLLSFETNFSISFTNFYWIPTMYSVKPILWGFCVWCPKINPLRIWQLLSKWIFFFFFPSSV